MQQSQLLDNPYQWQPRPIFDSIVALVNDVRTGKDVTGTNADLTTTVLNAVQGKVEGIDHRDTVEKIAAEIYFLLWGETCERWNKAKGADTVH